MSSTRIEVRQTAEFRAWLLALRDLRAQARIAERIELLADAQLGDLKSLGGEIAELRFHFGPGYRVYLTRLPGGAIVILLTGGDKSSQTRDIAKARRLAKRELAQ